VTIKEVPWEEQVGAKPVAISREYQSTHHLSVKTAQLLITKALCVWDSEVKAVEGLPCPRPRSFWRRNKKKIITPLRDVCCQLAFVRTACKPGLSWPGSWLMGNKPIGVGQATLHFNQAN